MNKPKRVAAAALMAAAAGAWAAADGPLQTAFAQFAKANAGDASPAAAVKSFAELSARDPQDPVLLAYLGAATTMQARDTLLPWKKMAYADEGLALLDKALALLRSRHDTAPLSQTPAALEVRLTAARTFLAVPDFMNRRARGQKLLAEVLASPSLMGAPLAFRGSAWLAGATEAMRAGDHDGARAQLQRLLDSGARQAAQARTLLQGALR